MLHKFFRRNKSRAKVFIDRVFSMLFEVYDFTPGDWFPGMISGMILNGTLPLIFTRLVAGISV